MYGYFKQNVFLKLSVIFLLCLQFKLSCTAVTFAQANDVAIQSNDYVISTGTQVDTDNITSIALVRYQTDGDFDPFFGPNGNGIVTTLVGNYSASYGVALQSTENILVTGTVNDVDTFSKLAIFRYLSDGSLDTSFGPDFLGYNLTLIGDGAIGKAVIVQPDDYIIVVGTTIIDGQVNLILVRYTNDGILDSSFGNNGIVTSNFGYHTGASAVALQSDGKIVVAGTTVIDGIWQVMLARYNNTDGSLDTNYGTSGVVTTIVGERSQANDIKIDANDFAVISGFTDSSLLVARYDQDGILDATFGLNGVTITPVGLNVFANAIGIQADDNILIAGASDDKIVLARYTTVGSLDNNFGNAGIALTLLGNTNIANALQFQSSGKPIVVGGKDNDFAVARYNTDGSLDLSWGINGIVSSIGGTSAIPSLAIDQKSSGVNGGSFASGSWITRELNTLIKGSSNIQIDSNRFILQPGIYNVSTYAPAFMVDNHKIRLQNVTDDITEAIGSASFSSSSNGAVSYSFLDVTLSVSAPHSYEVQHQCATTRANDGLGIATGFGDPEIYTSVKITRK